MMLWLHALICFRWPFPCLVQRGRQPCTHGHGEDQCRKSMFSQISLFIKMLQYMHWDWIPNSTTFEKWLVLGVLECWAWSPLSKLWNLWALRLGVKSLNQHIEHALNLINLQSAKCFWQIVTRHIVRKELKIGQLGSGVIKSKVVIWYC